jgi:beta-glucosidase
MRSPTRDASLSSPRFALCAIVIAWILSLTALLRAQTWADTTLSPPERAALLLSAMTQDEKLAMVHGTGAGTYVGHVAAVARLGVPDLNLQDGPAGVGDNLTQVTSFAAPITLAATWDTDLAERFGAAMGAEQMAKGTNVLLGPMMNIDRVPVAGRNFEGFGEDPELAAQMAAAVVQGIQGQGVIATAKHYIDNEQETDRATLSSVIDAKTQHEIYLAPFRACVDAGVGAVMCSYNRVNGTYACENPDTLNGWLKGELGFTGWIMSDWSATHSTVASVQAGLDMEMPSSTYLGSELASAVLTGAVPASRLDDMVQRVLTSMFAMGLFDRPSSGSPTADARSDAHTQLAREVAAEGTVLLKNASGILPLDAMALGSIAVIGPAGDASAIFQGGGSAAVSGTTGVTPLQGITARAGTSVAVAYAAGSASPFADATALASQSDVAIVVVATTSSEGSDRATLSLPADEDALVSAVAQANPRTIVVAYAPAQILMPWADDAAAILFGGLPGETEGDALASVLFGDVNPSGKLPMTFAQSPGDYSVQTTAQYPGVGGSTMYSEGCLVGYRFFDANGTSPVFPFGHGLSYTTFAYSNLAVAPAVVVMSGSITVSFDVTNTGPVAGAEVAQLYVALPSQASDPPWQLRAFQRVPLDPQATEHVTLTLVPAAYSFFSAGLQQWLAYPGTYALQVGSSSRDVRATWTFQVQGGPLAGTIHQAEAAEISCGAFIASTGSGYTGTGFVTGYTVTGASTIFTVDVPAAGPCAVTARYSAVQSAHTLSVYVNGSKVRQATFQPLANLEVWDFETETLDLVAGTNTIAYVSDSGDTGYVQIDALIDCVVSAPEAGASGSASDAGDDEIALSGSGQGAMSDASCPAPVPLGSAATGPVYGGSHSEGFGCGCCLGGATPTNQAALGGFLAAALAVVRRRRHSSSGERASSEATRAHVESSLLAACPRFPQLIREPSSGGQNTRARNVSFGVCRAT